MTEDQPVQPATSRLPIVTANDGNAYIGCDAVAILLRAMADSCRTLADDPDCDLNTAADAIDLEADNLDCRAIEHTTRRSPRPIGRGLRLSGQVSVRAAASTRSANARRFRANASASLRPIVAPSSPFSTNRCVGVAQSSVRRA